MENKILRCIAWAKFIMLLLVAHTAIAQVTVSVQLLPPYPSKITDYSSRPQLVVINVINTSAAVQRIQLRGAISGDNGIELRSKPSYKSRTPIVLNPGQARNLNGNDLAYFFDYTQLNYSGITQNEFITKNGLPEGTYQFCLQAFDYNTNEPLSADEPLGCSNPFIINNLEPPVIIKPFDGENITANGPQTFIISWSTPAGSAPDIKYRLRMVEILGNKNPNDAIMTAAQPYFFDKEVMGNMYVYNPADPQLTPGRSYAMLVEAFDPLGQRAFRNNGRSEVIAFTYGAPANADNLAQIKILTPLNDDVAVTDKKITPNVIEVNNKKDLYVRWDSVPGMPAAVTRFSMLISKNGQQVIKKQGSGMLFYQAPKNEVPLQGGQKYTVKVEGYNAADKLVAVSAEVPFTYKILPDEQAPVKDTLTLNARIAYRYDGESTTYAYGGKVYLYKTYTLTDTVGGKINEHTLPAELVYPDEDALVATGIADAGGNVQFKFYSNILPATVPAEVSSLYPAGGTLAASYKIKLANPYLADPADVITFGSASKNAGNLVATAYAYDLTANITKGFAASLTGNQSQKTVIVNQGLAGLRAIVYRKNKASGIPVNEGSRAVPPTFADTAARMLIVAEDTTRLAYNSKGEAQAQAVFKNLLCSPNINDTYWIAVYSNGQKVVDEPFRFERPVALRKKISAGVTQANAQNSYRYKVNTTLAWVTADAPLAKLKGRILYRYRDGVGGARSLANQKIRVVPVYVLSDTVTRKQYVVSEKSNLIPVASNNKRAMGEPEKAFKDLPNLIGDVNGTAGQTNADGSFTMNDIPLWDSVKNFSGLYNLPVPQLQMPEVPQLKPNDNIWNKIKDQTTNYAVNPGDAYLNNAMNPAAPYATVAGAGIGGGISNVNSASVIIGGNKSTIINQQINSFSLNTVAVGAGQLRGGPAGADWAGTPAAEEFVSPNAMKLVRCYRIVVDNDDYLSPDNNIIINPLESVDAGTLYADVRSFKAMIVVRGADNNKMLSNVKLTLRRNGGADPPKGESELVPARNFAAKGYNANTNQTYTDQLFSQLDSNRNVFNHLLASRSYYLESSINDTANNLVSYKDGYTRTVINHNATGIFNNDYTEPTVPVYINLEPDKPVIAGRVVNADGVNGIDGAVVDIAAKDVNIRLQTSNGGYYVYQADGDELTDVKVTVTVMGYQALKAASPSGNSTITINGQTFYTAYQTVQPVVSSSVTGSIITINAGDVPKGYKFFRNFYFEPKATLKGYVVNEQNAPVPALYKVEGTGLLMETQSSCATPPSGSTQPANQPGNNVPVSTGFSIGAVRLPGQVTTATVTTNSNTNASNKAGPAVINMSVSLTALCRQNFEAGVASGKPAKLIIIPNDLKYFNDTVEIANAAAGATQLGARKLVTREHRMRFIVRGRRKNGQLIPLAGAKITMLDSAFTTGSGGGVDYHFANISQRNFWLKVSSGNNNSFTAQELTITNAESKDYKIVNIILNEGDALFGTVTLAGKPLAGAEVNIMQGSGAASLITHTANDGTYQINAIKNSADDQVTVSVSAVSNTSNQFIVGQTRRVGINQAANFDLSTYSELDISHLLGYAIKVTGLEKSNGKTLLSGEVVMPDDAEFKNWDDAVKLTFSGVAVKAGAKRNAANIPLAEPEEDMELDNLNYKSRLGDYNVMISGGADERGLLATARNKAVGVVIKKLGAYSGAVSARAHVVDNSFTFPESYLSFSNSQFYLANKQGEGKFTNQLLLNGSVSSNTGAATAHQWYFSNSSGKSLNFTYLGFSASSTVAQSYFTGQSIRIKPVITAAVQTPDNRPLTVEMPEVAFSTRQVNAVTSDKPIVFVLENWTVKISNWVAATEEGGILATTASQNYVQTTAGLNIGFKTFRLRNNELLIDDINLSELKLGGIKDVQVNAGNVVFGLDERTGNDLGRHFVLRLLGQNGGTAGSIKGLPGFAGALDLEAVTLISNGEQYIDFATNSTAVKVYNVLNFTPLALEASAGGFRLAGNMDFGIPRLGGQYGGFIYTAGPGNTLKSELDVKAIQFDLGKGYVKFESVTNPDTDNGKKLLASNRLEFWGTVTEPGKLDKIPVKLVKQVDASGNAQISINQRDDLYVMAMGGSNAMKLKLSKTWSNVINNDWDYLRFTARMDDGYQGGGFGKEAMTFAVYGEIQVDDGAIQLSNINTPFGNMQLVFDWEKKEIRGTVQIEGPGGQPIAIPGGMKFKGMAEALLGTSGFYFVLNGDVNVPSVPLIFPFKAGILIAYHNNIPKQVFDKATQYMYNKTYPCGSNNGQSFKGFFIAARKDVIDPVDFNLDVPPGFPIASANVNIEIGFDATFYGSFNNGIELSFTPGAFGKVSLGLSSGLTCTQLGANVELNAMGRFSGQMLNGPLGDYAFVGALCMSLHLDGYIKQETPALIDCIAPTLVNFNKGFTVGAMFGLRVKMNPGDALDAAVHFNPADVLGSVKVQPFFKVLMSPCNQNMNLLCN